jgi:hypothetical protein
MAAGMIDDEVLGVFPFVVKRVVQFGSGISVHVWEEGKKPAASVNIGMGAYP